MVIVTNVRSKGPVIYYWRGGRLKVGGGGSSKILHFKFIWGFMKNPWGGGLRNSVEVRGLWKIF